MLKKNLKKQKFLKQILKIFQESFKFPQIFQNSRFFLKTIPSVSLNFLKISLKFLIFFNSLTFFKIP